jgi:hypothetical protein
MFCTFPHKRRILVPEPVGGVLQSQNFGDLPARRPRELAQKAKTNNFLNC